MSDHVDKDTKARQRAGSDPPAPRVYQHRLLTWYLWAMGLLGSIVSLSLTAAPMATILKVASGVFALAFLYLTWSVSDRGVEVRSDGIRAKRAFRWRSIPWGEVQLFAADQAALSPPIRIELLSGERLTLPLTQGRKASWQGGETRDVVNQLNRDLDDARCR